MNGIPTMIRRTAVREVSVSQYNGSSIRVSPETARLSRSNIVPMGLRGPHYAGKQGPIRYGRYRQFQSGSLSLDFCSVRKKIFPKNNKFKIIIAVHISMQIFRQKIDIAMANNWSKNRVEMSSFPGIAIA